MAIGFIESFWERNKSRKERKASIAAQKIENIRAENESKIKNNLKAICLPDTKYADTKEMKVLEDAIGYVIQVLDEPQTFPIDTSLIDKQLVVISEKFKNDVTKGNTRAAWAEKAALLTCLEKVRSQIPGITEKARAEAFLKSASDYVDLWMTVIEANANLASFENESKELIDKYNKSSKDAQEYTDLIDNKMQNDVKFGTAYRRLMTKTTSQIIDEGDEYDISVAEEIRKIKVKWIERDFDKVLKDQNLLQVTYRRSQIETMRTMVLRLPKDLNPNLLDKIYDQFKKCVERFEEDDLYIQKSVAMMDQIEGTIHKMEKSKGNLLALEQAQNTGEMLQRELARNEKKNKRNDKDIETALKRNQKWLEEERKKYAEEYETEYEDIEDDEIDMIIDQEQELQQVEEQEEEEEELVI